MTKFNKISSLLGLLSLTTSLGLSAATFEQSVAVNTSLNTQQQVSSSAANTEQNHLQSDTDLNANNGTATDINAQSDGGDVSAQGDSSGQVTNDTAVDAPNDDTASENASDSAESVETLLTKSGDIAQNATISLGELSAGTSTVVTQITQVGNTAALPNLVTLDNPVSAIMETSPSNTVGLDTIASSESTAMLSSAAHSINLAQATQHTTAVSGMASEAATTASQSINQSIVGAIDNSLSGASEQVIQQQVTGQVSQVVSQQIASAVQLQTASEVSNSLTNSLNLGL
ncbi:hypothetical protein [Paraglaciecola sp.]|uniref:hypothetical protein n=1 Tax=Paraglaciecola sp. TaxID=1920173 RepID=UPI00273EA2B1|nr:hypothetical protein [Paraglaciecola sp.]MDP5031010.1 hypothetical protein [Paraglaciecola sp.]